MQKSTVVIVSADGNNSSFGTAFVVHRGPRETHLVTAAHVIEQVGEQQARVCNETATVVADGRSAGLDLVVLRVAARLDYAPLHLCGAVREGSRVRVSGHVRHEDGHLERGLRGRLRRQTQYIPRGRVEATTFWDLEIEEDEKLQPGYSGSPILDDDDNCVAIATHERGQGDKGIAISINALQKIWTAYPTDMLFGDASLLRVPKPERSPRMNTEKEIDAFRDIVEGNDRQTRVIVIQGESGIGKTRLLEDYQELVATQNLHAHSVNLRRVVSVSDFLYEIAILVGFDALPSYLEVQRSITDDSSAATHQRLTLAMFGDLARLNPHRPFILFVDQFNDSDTEPMDRTLRSWFGTKFLPGCVNSHSLLVVVAGQQDPAPSFKSPKLVRFLLQAHPPTLWKHYAHQLGVELPFEHVCKLHKEYQGIPQHFIVYVDAERLLRLETPGDTELVE